MVHISQSRCSLQCNEKYSVHFFVLARLRLVRPLLYLWFYVEWTTRLHFFQQYTVAFITILSGCIIIIEKSFKKSRKLLRRWFRSKNDLPKCKRNNFKNKVSNKKKIGYLSILASFGPVLTNQRSFNWSYFEYWAYMIELWAEIQNHYWRRHLVLCIGLKVQYYEKVTQISKNIPT
mgnify:CR=1 FL=1